MNTRRKLTNTLCSVVGFIALGASAFGQQAEQAEPLNSGRSTAPTALQNKAGDFAGQGVAVFPPGFRQPTPQGGFCQLGNGVDVELDNSPSRNATTFTIVENFRPATTGNLTSVSFSGHYRNQVTPITDAAPPANESFIIRVYRDSGAGVPVTTSTPDGFPRAFTVNIGSTLTRSTPIPSENFTFNSVTYQTYNYVANLGAGVTLDAGQCYWVQVTNTSTFSPTTVHWRILIADRPAPNGNGTGDGFCFQASNAPTVGGIPTFTVIDGKYSVDWQMCFNLNGGPSGCTIAPRPVQCPQNYTGNTATPVTTAQPNCNVWTGEPSSNATLSDTTQACADNFSVSAAQVAGGGLSVSQICVNGVYTGQILPPPDESFEIRIFRNSTSGGSFPDTAQQVGPTITTVPSGNAATQAIAGVNTLTPNPQGFANYLRWTITIPAAQRPLITAAGCYWLQIRNTSTTGWIWVSRPNSTTGVNTATDGFYTSRPSTQTTYNLSSQVSGSDLTFCLSFAPVANTTCAQTPPATNISCAAGVATPLTIGAAPILGQTINAAVSASPPTINGLTDQSVNSVWYTVVGNGANITLSMCSTGNSGLITQTNYDTLLAVYCGTCTTDGTQLRSVAFNNDAADSPAAPCVPNTAGSTSGASVGASRVTFPSTMGTTYFVLVQRNGARDGFFWLNATTSAIGAVPPSDCASIIEPPCTVNQPAAGPGVLIVGEPCITSATDPAQINVSCQAATPLPLSTLAFDRLSTGDTNASQDLDWYRIPDVGAGGRWFDVELRSEAPVAIQFYAQGPTTCGATGNPVFAAASDSAFTIFPCASGVVFQQFVQEGQGIIIVFVGQFNGLPCSLNRNRYTIRVSPAAVGACCNATDGCIITTRDDCTNNQPGNEVGVFTNGATCTNSGATGCDFNNANNTNDFTLSFSQFGACCGGDGSCTVTIQSACPTGAGTSWTASTFPATSTGFTPLTVCLPAPNGIGCPAVVQRCCFTDGSCQSLVAAACTALGTGFTSSPGVCLPNTCPVVPTFGCCNAGGVAGCTVLTMAACTSAGGTVQTAFPGTCTGVTCPALTVPCCLQGICSLVLAADCTSNGGTVQGAAGTTCTGVTCPAATGLCCAGAICRTGITQAACVAFQTTAQWTANGAGTCPGTNLSPCCKANYNHTGARDVNDIFAFLADWFARRPASDILGNGTGAGGNVNNIFAFLAAWFAAGCT